MSNKKGLLITFEGGEGGGKTTQLSIIRDRLVAAGHDVILLREPGGTLISEQIREVVLSNKNIGMSYTTEVLLFQAARAQIYGEVILPALVDKKIVLMDRSRDSSVVYQGMVRGFGRELIDQLNTISTKDTFPDLTLLLDVPIEIGLQRRSQTAKMDRLDNEENNFHQQVRDAYLALAKENTEKRWLVIDASKDLEIVTESIWAIITKALQNKV